MIPGFPSPPGLRTPPLLVPRKLSMKNISIVVKMNVLRYNSLYHLKFGEMRDSEEDILNTYLRGLAFKTKSKRLIFFCGKCFFVFTMFCDFVRYISNIFITNVTYPKGHFSPFN